MLSERDDPLKTRFPPIVRAVSVPRLVITYAGGVDTGDPSTVRLLQLRAPIPLISPLTPGTSATPSVA
ncbi:unnamed protein product [Phytophthora lilii]|uniref:Unnamed protein product n=1 Tax=Phytophthora lilii TaxID=2077276 RepID=A0A9W6YK13_9STRA|nr:unnamed protein product [Phytophthora lilii]